jgi:hypothetical protein
MCRFLIRLVQVFALAMIGTSFLADTSFAKPLSPKQLCEIGGGTFVTERNGKYSCIMSDDYNKTVGANTVRNCTADGSRCSNSFCSGGRCWRVPVVPDKPKPGKPTKREDGTITMTAGTAADRGLRTPGATTSGAALNGGLNAVAPSRTAPAVSTGAALNTQAVTGLAGIDKPAAIPSQLSDRLNRMRR